MLIIKHILKTLGKYDNNADRFLEGLAVENVLSVILNSTSFHTNSLSGIGVVFTTDLGTVRYAHSIIEVIIRTAPNTPTTRIGA